MRSSRSSLLSNALLLASVTGASALQARDDYQDVCLQISSSISSASEVFFPLSVQYSQDIEHWAASSSQTSACSVEPGTAEDVGIILQIVANNSAPFAVKGGGHTANPGFSSTEGVHIAMTRFNSVDYDSSSGTVAVGPGLVWDDVYSALEADGVNVVGGRVPGVGVAGFTLGGGYSFKTNQYGLTIDTVKAFELVLPNGTVTTVTSDDEDLFFALKGGFNNFGIVTAFHLQTFPQTEVWGGLLTFSGDKFDALANATANFAQDTTDPKAAIISEFNTLAGVPLMTLNVFYDAPEQPEGIFDEFLAITPLTMDVKVRSFSDLIAATPSNAEAGARGVFNTVSLTSFDKATVDMILSELTRVGEDLATLLGTGTFISYDIEPFLPSLFSHAPEGSSAYPPSRQQAVYPLNIYYAWAVSAADTSFENEAAESASRIEAAAIAMGQDIADAGLYGNYAIAGTDLQRIYGADHLATMMQVKKEVDPTNVMALAGGWKISPAS